MDLTSKRASGLSTPPGGIPEDNSLHRRGLGGRLGTGLSVNEQEVKQDLLFFGRLRWFHSNTKIVFL